MSLEKFEEEREEEEREKQTIEGAKCRKVPLCIGQSL